MTIHMLLYRGVFDNDRLYNLVLKYFILSFMFNAYVYELTM